MNTTIIAVGKLRKPYAELSREYEKRFPEKISIIEIVAKGMESETKDIIRKIPENSYIVTLDEKGHDLSSAELAAKFLKWQESGKRNLIFIIGGHEGISIEVKEKANFVLSLGRKTWPHQLARIMLLEQLYRARQINLGHPYHRE